jgi:hypothetical protein
VNIKDTYKLSLLIIGGRNDKAYIKPTDKKQRGQEKTEGQKFFGCFQKYPWPEKVMPRDDGDAHSFQGNSGLKGFCKRIKHVYLSL